MEAKNYQGAARVIREKNPFGEVCGFACSAGRLCQKDCVRREFAGTPVRIAELQRWVCGAAGTQGWIKSDSRDRGVKVSIVGGGPSALSCAYFLRLTGCDVTVFTADDQPGGTLWQSAGAEQVLLCAIRNDIEGIMSTGISFQSGRKLAGNLEFGDLLQDSQAIYLPEAGNQQCIDDYDRWLGKDWRSSVDPQTGQWGANRRVFIGSEYMMNGNSVVEAVAWGRKVACSIDRFLSITK